MKITNLFLSVPPTALEEIKKLTRMAVSIIGKEWERRECLSVLEKYQIKLISTKMENHTHA